LLTQILISPLVKIPVFKCPFATGMELDMFIETLDARSEYHLRRTGKDYGYMH
jgi:hypothetical protein